MASGVNEWSQEGQLYVWCYANSKRGWHGWHFTADPTGCRSVRNLLDRMYGGEACHRTLKLGTVTDAILSVPNYAAKIKGQFEKLRIEYLPKFGDLHISDDPEALIMTVGDQRLRKLTAAFAEVEVGLGDFGIRTSEQKNAEPWMFWWMPCINYHDGKRM